jgi:hypothetical protein
VRHIAAIPRLKTFYYSYFPKLGNAGLQHMAQSVNLETLVIVQSNVCGAGLGSLRRMSKLRCLVYYDTGRSASEEADSSITQLSTLHQLRFLAVGGPWVHREREERLRAALPGTEVRTLAKEPEAYEKPVIGERGQEQPTRLRSSR